MKKLMVAACAATMVGAAFGSAQWYAGDGCLTDLEKWTENPVHPKEGGGDGPWVYFMKSSEGSLDYTVTLGADLRIRALFQNEKNLTVHADFAPYTLYTTYSDAMRVKSNGSTFRLESGTFSTKTLDESYGSINYWDNVNGATFAVDGPTAMVDGAINMRGGYGCACIITNGAKVTRGVNVHGYSNNRLVISGEGTEVKCLNDQFNVGGWHKQGEVTAGTACVTNNTCIISDGARVYDASAVYCGQYGSFSTLDVDGGILETEAVIIGTTAYSSNNTMCVRNGGKLLLGATKYIRLSCGDSTQGDKDAGSCGNTFELDNAVLDDTFAGFVIGTTYDWEPTYGRGNSNNTVRIRHQNLTIPVSSKFYTMGGRNNGVEITDGSVVTTYTAPYVGHGNYAHDNWLRVDNGAILSNLTENTGFKLAIRNGRRGRLEVLNNGLLWSLKSICLSAETAVTQGGGSLLHVASGGRVATETSIEIGRQMEYGGALASNRLEVVDGGSVECSRLRFYGLGNEVLVSNATLTVNSEFYSVYSNEENAGKDTRFIFAGKTPRFVMNGTYNHFYRQAHLKFVIPEGGYDTIPYENTVGAFSIQGDSTMDFDIEGFRKTGGKTVLMKVPAGQTFSFGAGQWEKLLEKVPQGCHLYLSDDETTLRPAATGGHLMVFRAPKSGGLMIIFR